MKTKPAQLILDDASCRISYLWGECESVQRGSLAYVAHIRCQRGFVPKVAFDSFVLSIYRGRDEHENLLIMKRIVLGL